MRPVFDCSSEFSGDLASDSCEEYRRSRRICLYCHADYRRVIGQRRVIGDPLAGDWGRHCRDSRIFTFYSRSGCNRRAVLSLCGAALGIEVVLTALFLYVIFDATASAARPGTAGLAIGGYLFVAPLIGVPLGDSSLNPARRIGPAILQGGTALANVWVFIVAPIVGGLVGYALYRITSKTDVE